MNSRSRILIVDDTPMNLRVLEKALEAEYDITLAASAMAALPLLESLHFDLILLDIVMPEMDGFSAFRALRKIPGAQDIPVVFITAMHDTQCQIAGLELGAIDFVFKPLQIDLLKLRIRNILHLARIEQRLRLSEQRMAFILEATHEGMWDWSLDSGEVTHNPTWCQTLGLSQTHLNHDYTFYASLIHPDDQPAVHQALQDALVHDQPYSREYRVRHADGHYFWIYDRGRVIERDHTGRPIRMAGIMQDIEQRKAHEEEIHRLAFFDPLTELPNRRLFIDRLTQAMVRCKRTHEVGALLYIDLDHFKTLNDTHGHAVGDLLLIEVARRLSSCVRSEDTVARLGGDEFVVLLERLAGYATRAARRIGDKILNELNRPYQLGELVYQCTPSIGLTLFGAGDNTLDEIMARGDQAMYQAKSGGRNRITQAAAL